MRKNGFLIHCICNFFVFCYLSSINVVCFSPKMPVLSKYMSSKERNIWKRRKLRLLMMHIMIQMLDPVREVWIHPLNVERYSKGEFYRLYLDQRYFPDKFFENYRMSTMQFDDILSRIHHLITKKDTNFRKAITPEEKLCVTLRQILIIINHKKINVHWKRLL